MANLTEINRKWRDFPMERSRAQRELQARLSAVREQIDALRTEVQTQEDQFDQDWKKRKEDLYEARNQAIKEAALDGKSGAEILREMGGNNTQLVYKLITEAMSEQAERHREETGEDISAPEQPQQDSELEGVAWQSHPHTGVHRWLVSPDGLFYKRYAPDADPEDESPEWYVAMVANNGFVAGSHSLWESTPADEAEKRVTMLQQLLSGQYAGKIRLGANPFLS